MKDFNRRARARAWDFVMNEESHLLPVLPGYRFESTRSPFVGIGSPGSPIRNGSESSDPFVRRFVSVLKVAGSLADLLLTW